MKFLIFISLVMTLCLKSSFAQIIEKPLGCMIGNNGHHPDALSHPEGKGVLYTERWSEIEITPGEFDFSSLIDKINVAKSNNLKYSFGIAAGAFGSPNWLIDSLGADFFTFEYAGEDWRLPLWWDPIVASRIEILIEALGEEFALDTSLTHVYITQMTTNGLEGHLNGVNMIDFNTSGYTDDLWINSALTTTGLFATAFPDVPIVFEVHEINSDTLVPAAIMNHLYNEPSYCERIGLGMWWISGKPDYQSDLLTYIENFEGDKYAQVIGRSDQLHRFQDSSYATVFTQAKSLGMRYIEPWPYEFQFHTHDSLLNDFNNWTSLNFDESDSCFFLNIEDMSLYNKEPISIYPNPFVDFFTISSRQKITLIKIYSLNGTMIMNQKVYDYSTQISRNSLVGHDACIITVIYEDGKSVSKKVLNID